jgi:WD40 repeat protein
MQTFQLTAPKGWVGRRVVQFTPDGRYLCVSANPGNLFDTLSDQPPEVLNNYVYGFAGDGALRVAGDSLITGSLVVTDFRTRESHVSKQEDCTIIDCVVSPDGKLLYVALFLPLWSPSGHEHEIRVFAADSLQLRYAFGRGQSPLWRLAISTSGDRLAVSGYDGLKVWNVATKRPAELLVLERPPRLVRDFALSNDGTRLATVDTSGLTIWDVTSGEQVVRSGKHRRAVLAVACSPTKPVLATGDNAGQVFLWDYTGHVLTRYDWGLGEVYGLAFAPDGLRCAVADEKGKVVVWDVDV